MKKYYSSVEQDKWVIEEVFKGKKNGFFLDLAAASGIRTSNTFALEKDYEWSGIAIEPHPGFYKKLIHNRSCITENVVVSNKREKVKFRHDNSFKSGIVAEDTDNSFSVRKDQLQSAKCKIIELHSVLLQDILDKHNAPKEIDYWSLDIEGSEERVLSVFDFSKYSFGCITIERPSSTCNEILQDQGYVFVKNYKWDTYYVHPKYSKNLKLEPFIQLPKKQK